MKVLITGSSGNLGKALSIRCKEKGYNVIGLDKKTSEETSIVCNIIDKKEIDRCMEGVDIVFHTATLHKPHIVTHTYRDFIETNTIGTHNLLESATKNNVKTFIFSSTTSIYGDMLAPDQGRPSSWIDENTHIESKNIYGSTKLGSEELCRVFSRNHGLNCIVLRLSRFFYEEDDNPEIRNHYSADNAKVNELLYRRVDIDDAVNAHLSAALDYTPEQGFDRFVISATTPFTKEHCHLLNQNADSVIQTLFPHYQDIYNQLGWKMFPRIDRVYVNDKARRLLKWQPKYSFEHALDSLSHHRPFRSPLAEKIGWRRYHDQIFENAPYPV